MRTSALLLAILGPALALGACTDHGAAVAASEATMGRRADAIQGGKPDTTSTFAVAVLDDQNSTCSGTLIAPNLVLTARHCVAGDNGGASVDCAKDHFLPSNAASTLRVSTDAADASFETAAFHATRIIVPVDTSFCGNDLALIILDKLVPGSVATPATPAIDPPLTDRVKYGTKLTGIGYGTTAPGASDQGTRHARAGIPITCIPGDAATLACNPADYDMTAGELAAGNGLCEGDSGSGAFEPTSLAAGAPIVIGVLSRATDSAGQCSDSIYGRTDTASALLIDAAKEAAMIGGYRVPAWADPSAIEPDAGPSDPVASGDSSADAGTPAADTTSSCSLATRPVRETCVPLLALAALALLTLSRRRSRGRSLPNSSSRELEGRSPSKPGQSPSKQG